MKNVLTPFFTLIVLALWPATAFAYLDPGTGSMIIQATIASIVAVGYVAKIYWDKILRLFSRKKNVNLDEKNIK